jgi:hypothetical protein
MNAVNKSKPEKNFLNSTAYNGAIMLGVQHESWSSKTSFKRNFDFQKNESETTSAAQGAL